LKAHLRAIYNRQQINKFPFLNPFLFYEAMKHGHATTQAVSMLGTRRTRTRARYVSDTSHLVWLTEHGQTSPGHGPDIAESLLFGSWVCWDKQERISPIRTDVFFVGHGESSDTMTRG